MSDNHTSPQTLIDAMLRETDPPPSPFRMERGRG
jgi:hypothetical protein